MLPEVQRGAPIPRGGLREDRDLDGVVHPDVRLVFRRYLHASSSR